jgi:hypothetical protein
MAFYPLFNITDCKGFVTLANFSPNNWENANEQKKTIWAIWSDGKCWNTKKVREILPNSFETFQTKDFEEIIKINSKDLSSELVLLEMRIDELKPQLESLPSNSLPLTHYPEWRSTIGFSKNDAEVSYQGEIDPLPPKATLLTFHPFIQHNEVQNYLVFLNIEKSPNFRFGDLELFNSKTKEKIAEIKVRSNFVNIIPLDEYGFSPNDLPVFYCKNMGGVPFGFGIGTNSQILSLEHTHPPGSFTLHGNRMNSQKYIKTQWSKLLNI